MPVFSLFKVSRLSCQTFTWLRKRENSPSDMFVKSFALSFPTVRWKPKLVFRYANTNTFSHVTLVFDD